MKALHCALALPLLALAGCSSSAPSASAPTPAPVARSAGASATPSVLPPAASLSSCRTLTTTVLSTDFPGTTWTAATPVHTANNCTTSLTDGAGASTISVSYATTSDSTTLVGQFRQSPPPLKGATALPDLNVGVPSAGVTAPGKVLNTDYLFELAEPTYLISIQASLTSTTMSGLSAQAAAAKLARWAISQQP